MIEFEKKYSTPLAQKQFELEQVIKYYELEHAANVSRVMQSLAGGISYVLFMGLLVGYQTFNNGYVVAAVLFISAAGLLIGSKLLTKHAKTSDPDLTSPEKYIVDRRLDMLKKNG